MSCKIENIKYKGQEIESKLGQSLLDIYNGNLEEAKNKYDTLASQDFISKFGDWINEDIEVNTNEQGEPLLYTDTKMDGSKHHYFILKNGEPFDVIPREFSSFTSYDLTNEIKEITEQLVRHIFTNNFNSDFESIDGSTLDIVKEIENFINEKKAPIQDYINSNELDETEIEELQEAIQYLDNINKHSSEFKSEIIKFFNERKISVKDHELEDVSQENLEEGLQGGDLMQSIERNSKDSVTANVKLMLSFLPKINNLTGEEIAGDYLGETLFQPFDAVYTELQNELSDITTLYLEGYVSDVYKSMVSKITELSKVKKSYKVLLDMLDNIDENKRTEFVQAFYLSKVNFYTSTTTGKGNDFKFKVQNVTNVGGPIDNKLKDYYVNFKNLFLDKKNKLNKESLKSIKKEVGDILTNVRKDNRIAKLKSQDEFTEQFSDDALKLINIFERLGVESLTDEAFELFLKQLQFENSDNSYKLMYNKLTGTLNNLDNLLDKLIKGQINAVTHNPFKEFSGYIFNSLAEAENYFEDNLSDNTIFSGGKTYWTRTRPSYLSNRINEFKQFPDSLINLKDSAYAKDSLWADHLLGQEKTIDGDYIISATSRQNVSNGRLNNFELGRFNSFQEEGKSIEGNDNKTISKVDQLVDNINKVLQGSIDGRSSIYTTSTPADKASLHEIKIDFFKEGTIHSIEGDVITFSEETLEIFTDYFSTEIDRMRTAYNELENLPEDKLQVHYHINAKGEKYKTITDNNGKVRDVLLGNAFKSSHILSELSPENITPELNKILKLYKKDYSPLNPDVTGLTKEQRGHIKAEVNRILNELILKDYNRLSDLRIFESNKDGSNINTNGINEDILEQHKVDNKLSRESALHLTSDYVINSVIANIEYTKLFTGDPAFYKNMVDFFKRVPATYTDGINLRVGITENDHKFNIAVLENINVESPFLEEIKKSLENTDLTSEEKEYILESYAGVNQTDAQAWITPKRWAFLMSRTGKWNDKYQSVYDKLRKGLTLSADELKTVAQPVKGVYFGLVNNVPTYLKYSQAVLIPQLVEGTQLSRLSNKMNSQNIDESIVLDGVKVGATLPNKWTNENGDIEIDNLSSITLDNRDWKLQQDLPTKTIKPTLLGSQIQKNLLKSIYNDGVYELDGKLLTGDEIYREINEVTSLLSDSGLNKLKNELNYTEDSGVIDKNKLYELLERELLDRGTSTNLLKAVQKNLPIEAIPGIKDKLYNIIFSKFKSASVKLKTNGGSFIQMSNFGLDKFTGDAKGVKWLVEPSALKPPVIEKDADGKSYIVPGQILISHSQIAKYLPDYKSYSISELNKKIDRRLLRAIGYRIPNQGMSSNDPLQIVGILPEGMGDTIVAYTEITTKTGSDFDIDKMYVMLPSSKKEYGSKLRPILKKAGITRELATRMLEKEGIPVINNKDADITFFEYLQNKVDNGEPLSEELKQLVGSIEDITADKLIYDQIPEGKVYNAQTTPSSQIENRLFEAYWSILTNERTYGDLITPIDFPHIKDKIKELHGDNSKQTGELFKFNDPIYQLDLKFIYGAGKSGVGITANMLVDHNRSKFYPMTFNRYNLGVGHMNNNNETVFDNEYSVELNGTKYKIGDTISAFLNAFVDNAKDPYINDGNFNTYTSSVAFMLMRAGVHPDHIVAFIGQPILKKLVQFTNNYESKSIPKENEYESSFDIIVNNLINQAEAEIGDKIEFNSLKSNLKSFSYQQLADNILADRDGQSTFDTLDDLKILKIFKELQTQAKKLNESVQLSRFDTIGAGKDVIDLITYSNRIREMFVNQDKVGELNGHFKKYYNEKSNGLTSLGTQVNNTLGILDTIMNNNPSLFLLGSTPMQKLFNNISISLIESRGGSRGLLKDIKLGQKLMTEVYKYIMSDFAPFKIEGNPLDYIKDTSRLISEYKTEDKEFETGNFFMENISLLDNSFGIINKNKSIEFQDRLYRSAKDLLDENPELANRIFVSSFLMNGFETKMIDMKEFIPYEWFIENGIREFIVNKNIQFQNDSTMLNGFRDQFIKNNIDDNRLAPKISAKVVKKIPGTKDKTIGFELESTEPKHSRYLVGKTKDNKPVFVKYLKMGDNLFELYSYYDNIATYIPSESKGFEDKQSFLNLKEYSYNENKESYFNQDTPHNKNAKRIREWAKYNLTYENGYVMEYDRRINSNKFSNTMYHTDIRTIIDENQNVQTQESNFNVQVYDKIDDNAYSISIDYNNRRYSLVLDRDGEITDPTYYDSNKLKDIDSKIILSKDQVDQIFNEIETKGSVVSPEVDTSSSWNILRSQPVYTEQGVNTMRTSNKEIAHAHFGNPFSASGYSGTIKMPSVEAAVQAYKNWLTTNKNSDPVLQKEYGVIKPKQKEWILDQINSGKLDNAILLYDNKLAARGQGTHAHALAEVVNELRGAQNELRGEQTDKNDFTQDKCE